MNQMEINGEELVFGLDIGTRSVVGTIGYNEGERFIVIAQEIREHQTRAMLDGQIHDINRVAATIRDIKVSLQEKTGYVLEEVCIAAAGRVLKTKTIHADMDFEKEHNVTKEDMDTLVSLGVEKAFGEFQKENDTDIHFYCVGYSVVKYYLNGLWMGQPEHHKAKSIGADLIATFLPEDVVDGLYQAVELADLRVANLTLEPIAAIRVAIPERFRLLNIAMVDVGAGTSDISITNDGSVIAFGMLPHAGDLLTEALAKSCLIDFVTAEKLKTAATTQTKIVYEDIMGIEQTITADEVIAICQPEIDKMAKLTADTIVELNGGTSPSAVFIVGGGGKIKGFSDKIASELGLDPSRVALRGEEILRNVEFPEGSLMDSTIITPIGICLSYYDQNNNFIHITFNGSRLKLYDNNKLAVVDAAMQANFVKDGLFPRRGKELRFTVNGRKRMKRGEYGESAHVYVNGEAVNLSFRIKPNDVVVIEEATVGKAAEERIGNLVDYSGSIALIVDGEVQQLPKPVRVNGKEEFADYMIQEGDEVIIDTYYTYDGLIEYLGYATEDTILIVNGEKIPRDAFIYANDRVEVHTEMDTDYEEMEEYGEAAYEQAEYGTYEYSKVVESTGSFNKKETEESKNAQSFVGGNTQEAQEVSAAYGSNVDDKNSESSMESGASNVYGGTPENGGLSENQKDVKESGETSENGELNENSENLYSESTKVNKETLENGELNGSQEGAYQENSNVNGETTPNSNASELQPEEEKKQNNSENVIQTILENGVKEEVAEPDGTKKIIVIVNENPIVMNGKKGYVFTDIFDYIDFDLSKMQGAGIVTLVNGTNAQYTQPLYNGDKIEVYWKEKEV